MSACLNDPNSIYLPNTQPRPFTKLKALDMDVVVADLLKAF